MRNPSVLCGTVNSIHRNGRESVAVHVDKTKDNSLINDISRVCVCVCWLRNEFPEMPLHLKLIKWKHGASACWNSCSVHQLWLHCWHIRPTITYMMHLCSYAYSSFLWLPAELHHPQRCCKPLWVNTNTCTYRPLLEAPLVYSSITCPCRAPWLHQTHQ